MNVIEAIKQRRATKQFDSKFILSSDQKKQLIELVLENAPSAFNLQHWRPVLVEDPALRAQIREIAWDQPQVTDASMLIVLCAEVTSWQTKPQRVWEGATEQVKSLMTSAIDQYYRDRPQVQRDEIMRSAGIFAQTLMLAAKGQGLDSCPMDGFDFDAMAKLIKLPENHEVCLMIAVGKANTEPYPRTGKFDFSDVVKVDHF
ncbi:nitroreductase family protein [Moellerella wisconsensis]|uniref:Nitroreductase n=1 Tax=Moellerella wisconsensis ATCC 35017 TaxID=1354267 RepID=A0A0N0Z740_9GAMM|nr:nitroreductase family protein [Moellerella wisconsensis]KPD02255.1 nitroreductase [Moellerella wisconsensis ATCC 35017]VFS53909.1 dihydropteridine reductase [Moellerella wisconsensis]